MKLKASIIAVLILLAGALCFAYFWYGKHTVVVEPVVIDEPVMTAPVEITTNTATTSAIETQIVQKETPTNRILLNREELFEREKELFEQFGLEQSEGFGTARLYWLGNEIDPEVTFSLMQERGISILIPHNKNYGSPYYELTPFDLVDGAVWYGEINPCPAGCPGTKGFLRGKILFHELGSTKRIVKEFESAHERDGGSCKKVAVNKNTSGTYCFAENGHMIDPKILIEGAKYTYEITDQRCRLYDEKEVAECKTIAESIKVE